MTVPTRNVNKLIRIASIAAITFIVCWGLVLVLAQVKPFWIDEWRIIYNLKYKDAAGLWGQLDFMQQFPRVYLVIIKAFSSIFDYSYFSLRFPSFLIGTLTILFSYRVAHKLFKENATCRFLFVLIIAASPTFTDYFVQVKQYTMDIMLGVLALWQLLQLTDVLKQKDMSKQRYLLLCASFVTAPFFSYTYPIMIAPVFVVMFIHSIVQYRSHGGNGKDMHSMRKLWLPLILCTCAIIAFYRVDASQLMKDDGMHIYWGYRMMQRGFSLRQFFGGFYDLFALCGAGIAFEIIFGTLGILGLLLSATACARSLKKNAWRIEDFLSWYSVSVVVLIMLLFSAGKLAVGEARLTCFCVPVVALTIISFVNYLLNSRANKVGTIVMPLLFIGVIGNAFSSLINEQLADKHRQTLNIYVNTENAIKLATAKNIPIFISSGIAYPYEKIINFPCTEIPAKVLYTLPQNINTINADLKDNVPGDWVLKTFPAYKTRADIPVYALNDPDDLKNRMLQLPPTIKSVIIGNGSTFREVVRQ